MREVKTMKNAKRIADIAGTMLWDILSVTVSVLLAFKVAFYSTLTTFMSIPSFFLKPPLVLILVIAGLAGIFVLTNFLCGCYGQVLRHIAFPDIIRLECISVPVSCLVCALLGYALAYLNGLIFDLTRVIIFYIIFMLLFPLLGRAAPRLSSLVQARMYRKAMCSAGEPMKRALIFGAGEAGQHLYNRLHTSLTDRLQPVVFIDDNEFFWGKKVCGLRVFGGREKLSEAIHKYDVDEVIVAIPTASRELLEFVLEICREEKCQLRRYGTIDDIELTNAKLDNINLEELLRRDSVQLNMQAVRNFVRDKVIMVTGGAGSIGSEICRQVLNYGCGHLVIFDINENGLFDIENELKEAYDKDRFSMRLGSIRDRKRIGEVMDEFRPALIFHAAAHKHVPMMEYSPREAIKNNVFGTINIAQEAISRSVEKLIMISTDKAVNPTNIMGASKRIAEKTVQMMNGLSKTEIAAVRFGNVLGSNGSVVPLFRKQIEAGGPVTITHPDMRRYFMTIPEAVQLVLEAGAMAAGGEIFVLDMGKPVKIYDLACDLIRLSGYEPEKDIEIKCIGLRPGEKLVEELRMAEEDVSKTANSKIYVMKPLKFNETNLARQIKRLEKSIAEPDIGHLFDAVQKLVPTFRHQPGTELEAEE